MDTAELREIVGEEHVQENVSLAGYTTFRIGGPADVLVQAGEEEQLERVLAWCRESGRPWILLGRGSNVLVDDAGFRGTVILLDGTLAQIEVRGDQITAGAGASLARIARTALEHELTGVEYAAGIPGTLGGAVYMNAGAYGGEIGRTVSSIRYLDKEGIHEIGPEEAGFEYRSSRFMRENAIVLGAEMTLQPGDRQAIMDRMQELAEQRKSKQPLEYPSAGSMFKHPEGFFAGKLIQDAGLAGYSVGGAQVSEKHCGFVINRGNATAEDVRELVRQVADRVEQTFGVRLEPEVRYLSQEGLKPLLA